LASKQSYIGFRKNVVSFGKTHFYCLTSKTHNFAERLFENTQTLLPFYFAKRSEKEISLKPHMEPDNRALGTQMLRARFVRIVPG
jgi:hypothetical protein